MRLKILLAGEGGQGVQSIAKIIAKAAQKSGKKVTYLPGFGVEQRGGVSLSFIQISKEDIPFPRFAKADFIVAFCDRAVNSLREYLQESSFLIYDNSLINDKSLEKIRDAVKNYLAVPAKKIAQEKFTSKTANMVLLGALSANLKEINFDELQKEVLEAFQEKAAKNPEISKMNIDAFKVGKSLAENFDKQKSPLTGKDEAKIECVFQKENISWTRIPDYCKGCGLCIEVCPVKCLRFSDDLGFLGNPMPTIDIEKCIGCKKCMDICPDGAIEVEKNN